MIDLQKMLNGREFDFLPCQLVMLISPKGKSMYSSCLLFSLFYAGEPFQYHWIDVKIAFEFYNVIPGFNYCPFSLMIRLELQNPTGDMLTKLCGHVQGAACYWLLAAGCWLLTDD